MAVASVIAIFLLCDVPLHDMLLSIAKYHIFGKKVSIMSEKDKKGRVKNMIDGILDAAFKEFEGLGVDAISVVFQDVKEWGINKYNQLKTPSDNEPQMTLEDLQHYLDKHNEIVEIGVEQEKIAVMWAMKKLGYSEGVLSFTPYTFAIIYEERAFRRGFM